MWLGETFTEVFCNSVMDIAIAWKDWGKSAQIVVLFYHMKLVHSNCVTKFEYLFIVDIDFTSAATKNHKLHYC